MYGILSRRLWLLPAVLLPLLLAACQTTDSGSEQSSPPSASTPQQPQSQSAPPPGGQDSGASSSGAPASGSPGAPAAGAPGTTGQRGDSSDPGQDAGAPTGGEQASTNGDPGSSGDPDTGTATNGDADAVLDQALEAFRRSAARERSSEIPQTLPESEAGEQTGSGATAGTTDEDIDDLAGRDLEELLGAASGEAQEQGDASGTDAGSGETHGGSAPGEGEQTGPWHQPGSGGRRNDPDPGEVYADQTSSGASASGTSAGDERPRTSAERQAELERVLAESLGDFDGRILDEREAILARRDRDARTDRSEEAGSGGSGSGQGEGDEAGRRPAPAPPGSQDGNDHVGGGPVGGPATDSQRDGEFPIPDDVGDGADDDVVARQLREAAMNEPDPELRERLWDEYRRYVEGRR